MHIENREETVRSFDYKGSVNWAIRPATEWRYGLLLDPKDPSRHIKVEFNGISQYPFADLDEMIYDSETGSYDRWNKPAPLVLKARVFEIQDWTMKQNSAAAPPDLTKKYEPTEKSIIELVPYGCGRLRVTEFPFLKPGMLVN